ncbi:MAG: hypothetical protein ACQETE_09375 [Bacteroidota bacterium]|jgi:ElaB/YqjD/DUF883 family membrane-anchored ribosome-binding protein
MNEEILSSLNRRIDKALEQGRIALADEEVQQRIQEIRERAENLVRKYPVQSIGAGLLFGYLIGRLMNVEEED